MPPTVEEMVGGKKSKILSLLKREKTLARSKVNCIFQIAVMIRAG